MALDIRRGSPKTTAWLATLERTPPSELGKLALFIDSGGPLPPAVTAAEAFATGEEAIATLREIVADGGPVASQAAQDLQQLQRDAVAPD